MEPQQPLFARLECVLGMILGIAALLAAASSSGWIRLLAVPGAAWIVCSGFILVGTFGWDDRSVAHQHRFVLFAHAIVILPFVLEIAVVAPWSPVSIEPSPGTSDADDAPEDDEDASPLLPP